ncbi:MAG: hypothetical protein GY755_15980 [Chloroflexi bacterium]|nr:hypothetical protein [Chloroflexota bacterium]
MKKYKFFSFIMFFVIILTACTPEQNTPAINMTEIQNTAIVVVQTKIALTQAALPTTTQEATPTITLSTPSPYPTQTPYTLRITPDANQVERWQEYQTELAKNILPRELPEYILCEWVILGHSSQNLFIEAICLGNGRAIRPAVIHLELDGSIKSIETVRYGSTRDANIQRLFPPEIQEMFYDGSLKVIREQLSAHLDWRTVRLEEPPLIVLSAIPTATSIP